MKILKFIWSIPLGIIGLFITGLIFIITKIDTIKLTSSAIDVVVDGWLAQTMNKRAIGATTIGWTIFFWSPSQYVDQQKIHERVHVQQFASWGIIYPIIYIYWHITKGYRNNPFEVEAYKVDGRGSNFLDIKL